MHNAYRCLSNLSLDGDEQSTYYVNVLSYIFRRKKESRLPHELSQKAKKLRGIK